MTDQALQNSGSPSPLYRGAFGPALTIGFGAAVLMWVIAWVLHMPGVHVPTPIAIPLLLLPLLAIAMRWLPGVSAPVRIKAGVLSGLIAGLVNLMILGSFITEQPESTAEMSEKANELAPNAFLVIVGSIVVSIIVALVAALIVKGKSTPAIDTRSWLSRFAWVTAMTYIPLIAVGGIVTSTDSGLAVPDAVTSYGAISVLFPLKLMAEPRIFFEHSHRLLGTLAGLTTLVLMVRVLMTEKRLMPKAMSVVLFLSVCLQGYLGIIRVAESSTAFAIFHGVFAQLVFALALVLAMLLSTKWINANPSDAVLPLARKARLLTGLAFGGLIIQLVFGAMTRHMNTSHAMMSHMGFAFIVVALVLIAGAVCIRAGKQDDSGRAIRPLGIIMHGIVVWQFALGFAVLGLVWEENPPELPTPETLTQAHPIEALPALIATAHHLSGALLLATSACAFAWAIHLARKPKIR
ncbi:MAG: heme A synthase [Phycisphaerales bacterium JB052]